MKTLQILILAVLGIVVITCTSFFLIYPLVYNKQQSMMTNFGPFNQVTTVIIPQGAEDQSSGKNYDPQYIRVIIGVNNTVRWINDDFTMNSVVADNSSDPDFYDVTNRFSAVMENAKMPNFLKPGESFEYTFTKPGYFGYHGVPHPWQRGWVLVLTSDQSDKQIPEHTDFGASGLHDTYAAGQKIDFTIELSGYGITCPVPDIIIQRLDGDIIWHANHPAITSCDPQRGGFRIQYKLSDGFGVPIINETGSYMVVVSYDNQTMRLPFVVVPSTINIKDLSESLPQYPSSTVSFEICDIPYPRSNTGVAVLYMPSNSTGKICATYHNPDSPTQSSTRVFTAKDVQQQANEITISAHPDIVPTGNSTIVYTIKTESQAGLYGISFFCGSIPFVVGYDNQSRIILDDFPWLYKNDICLSQTNVFQITGLSGIHVKYVTEVHRG